MINFLMYPLNIIVVVFLGMIFTSMGLSYFYNTPSSDDYLILTTLMLFAAVFYFLSRDTLKQNYKQDFINKKEISKLIKILLIVSLSGFLLEIILYGVPLLVSGGRDEYKTLPILHVLFYSMLITTSLLASNFGSKKIIFLSLLSIAIISILFLTRQMLMVSFMIFLFSYLRKGKVSKKKYLYSILVIVFIGLAFSFLGNVRQQTSGDYVNDYVYIIGGAKPEARDFGTSFYWIWLYIGSPFYNLFYNLHIHDISANPCSNFNSYGDCIIPYIDNSILPNTIAKYTTNQAIQVSTVVSNLTVGTGFSKSARIFGILGIYIKVILQFIFYIVGFLMIPKVFRNCYIIYFSVLSFFMVFDDLYVKGEFFLVFLILYLIAKLKGCKLYV